MTSRGILKLEVVPQSCGECNFSKATLGFCVVIEKPTVHYRKGLRHPDCPIEEVDVSGPRVVQTALFGVEEVVA
jgi:hypothetical protein